MKPEVAKLKKKAKRGSRMHRKIKETASEGVEHQGEVRSQGREGADVKEVAGSEVDAVDFDFARFQEQVEGR